jgi:hypothetical protein
MNATTLLARLDGVRQTRPDRWIARCPAHEDRAPSLSIREGENDNVLLHCFAGCSAAAVVEAIGMELSDLFPPRLEHYREPVPRSQRPMLTMSELVALLRYSVTAVGLAAEDMAAGRALSPEDLEALRTVAARVNRVLEAVDA